MVVSGTKRWLWTILADTGAGTALSLLSGRALLQASSDIPNYATGSGPPAASGESLLSPSFAGVHDTTSFACRPPHGTARP